MIYTIANEALSVSINTNGAALTSIKGASGQEFLWHGDAKIWAGQAPNLFPFIGKVNNNSYTYQGQTHAMTRHGFARDSEFQLVKQTPTSATLRLSDNAATLVNYPFAFDLDICFSLQNNRLTVAYQVHNRSDQVMPFSLGAHPAFACNWQAGDAITDYYLEFEKLETSSYVQFNGVALGRKRHACLQQSRQLLLTETMFDIDSLIFDDLKSEAITLRSHKAASAEQWVRVEYAGFPYMGIWSKPKAPYICIEPWYGVDDYEDASGDVMEKEGVQILPPHTQFECQYHIVVGKP